MKECKTIEVITTSGSLDGIYEISEERTPKAMNNPVWRQPGDDLYFFNPGTNWMIGSYNHLTFTGLQSYYIEGI